MDPSLQPLLGRLNQLPDQFRDIRDGVQKAIRIADEDPEMALTRSRKVLELVVREVYERRINEPAGTRPLENLLQRLVKDGHLPTRLDAHANSVRLLGNVGTHGFGQPITAADVQQSLSGLLHVLEWYAQEEQPGANIQQASQPARGKSGSRPAIRISVVPKGLRSFDANDADFFLDLLPGPRDRDGLPDGIRFWKHRIEEKNEPTFTVGVIYGPSGCGKSSLVKAGLLPSLTERILSVYVEATAEDTEARLLRGLRKRCAALPADLDLVGTIAALRHGTGLGGGQKMLLVIDQFEQWLHARRGEANPELTQALRQCDGERVQCIVLVRDDFWMALTRFMADLHIELLQGQNIGPVDLFDALHARNVLAAFGQAFGRLPEEPSKEQVSFLDQAVAGLSQDGRVICVRLALFADMVKSRPWAPATLREVGGTQGVGVAFLEETFGTAASPQHRLHQQAARAVLKALLPEQGSDIKGNMQSQEKLLLASGYARRSRDFEELLRILDGELRLITPTQPPERARADEGQSDAPAEKYYQLTHDYLVHSLREWLARKQTETRRGRAELRLAERVALWQVKPENRHLPAWWEWASIRLLTRKRDWTPPQRKMMRKAARYHGVRAAVLALLLGAGLIVGLGIRGQVIEQGRADHAAALVHRLLDADIAQVPDVIKQMKGYRRWSDPLLRQANEEAAEDSRQKLYASLALLPVDESQVEYLSGRLLKASPTELPVIVDALRGHRDALVGRLWSVLENTQAEPGQRFRAACALASYDGTEDDTTRKRWKDLSPFVTDQLLAAVQQNPSHYGPLLGTLRPVRDRLTGPLSDVFRNGRRPKEDQTWATSILADYAADQADLLFDLIQDADERQFAVLYRTLAPYQEQAVAAMDETVAADLESLKGDEEKERLAKRQANAAVVLLRLGRAERVWPLLEHPAHPLARACGFSDPRVRSYLIDRLRPLGADPRALLERLDREKKISIRRALLLALAEFDPDQLSPTDREPLLSRVWELYRNDPDSGLHGAAERFLRVWGQQDRLEAFDQEWIGDKQKRKEREEHLQRELAWDTARGQGHWYVNGQGQTMVVIPGPVKFLIGSPPSEAGREGGPAGKNEQQHEKQISRSFAIAARKVTVRQFLRFRKDHTYEKDYSPADDCPVNTVLWYGAAAYCNWLSEQEGIARDQWCYLPNGQNEYSEGMRLAPDYLHRTGYRLPSEAEWEYACRAGAYTSRYYGEKEELLGRYAWYTKASLDAGMLPGLPGRLGVRGDCLKPNDFGLFDMLGNAWEWCQDRMGPYQSGEDVEGDTSVKDRDSRLLRGGCFYTQARYVRAAYRDRSVPGYLMGNNGFRVARTFR
jgi:formylglycine-generating enzyme required for sulfatase activity